jgi:hypothetical protein
MSRLFLKVCVAPFRPKYWFGACFARSKLSRNSEPEVLSATVIVAVRSSVSLPAHNGVRHHLVLAASATLRMCDRQMCCCCSILGNHLIAHNPSQATAQHSQRVQEECLCVSSPDARPEAAGAVAVARAEARPLRVEQVLAWRSLDQPQRPLFLLLDQSHQPQHPILGRGCATAAVRCAGAAQTCQLRRRSRMRRPLGLHGPLWEAAPAETCPAREHSWQCHKNFVHTNLGSQRAS